MSALLVGRVSALWRYPVKSMAAEGLDAVDVAWNGLVGDRRWAFVRDGLPGNGFPWLTIRQRADLGLFRPSFVEPDRPDASDVVVRTPEGKELELLDPALAAHLDARVMKLDRGTFDAVPLSLITTRTVTALGALVGADLDARRFRPNLVIEPTDGTPFAEDSWVGRTLRIGDLLMHADRRDRRCAIVNIDPETADRDSRVLRAIAAERDLCLGVYGTVAAPGRVAVGDPVILEP
ncbi:MOSC domain-containing protein [Longispora sp. K20-0274]|uniref:MOSC domain-containing protein n=1 Tax=Longispora sp. K20-0274 TaxID=3088255 RepID=UPI00399AF781